jgi:motility quorum-sensing regulator / GCU-specific mRNA interferase toxin
LEKRKAHYPLADVRRLVEERRAGFTKTALEDGTAMGFDAEEMLQVVAKLKAKDLHKSMTTHRDHKLWQDVYHADTEHGVAYVKLTVVEDLLIVSFKEKDA